MAILHLAHTIAADDADCCSCAWDSTAGRGARGGRKREDKAVGGSVSLCAGSNPTNQVVGSPSPDLLGQARNTRAVLHMQIRELFILLTNLQKFTSSQSLQNILLPRLK
jgi:hypothetical protein